MSSVGVLAAEAEPVPAPMVGSFVGVLSLLLPETDSVTEPDVLLPEPCCAESVTALTLRACC